MDKEATSHVMEDGDDGSSPTRLMEPLATVTKEIKEEDFDDFHQENLLSVQKSEDEAALEYKLKTETHQPSLPNLPCKEEGFSPEDIGEQTEEDLGDDSATTRLMEPHATVKKEIKEEDLDDILPECLLTVQKLEDQPGLEHDLTTETPQLSSPTLSCKEETEHIKGDIDMIPQTGNPEGKGDKERSCHKHSQCRKTSEQESLQPSDTTEVNSHEDLQCFQTSPGPSADGIDQGMFTGESGKSSLELNAHRQSLSGEKPHQCLECGKGFSKASNLKVHMRIHTGGRPYQCVLCGKAFRHICSLKIHQRIHSEEKPYQCATCEKSFRTSSELNTHRRIHSGENLHWCPECGKGFSKASKLKIHMRIHTGEKPYQCSVCGKGFSQICNLKTHQRNHTEEKPYRCSQCGKGFPYISYLKRHQRIHIGEN